MQLQLFRRDAADRSLAERGQAMVEVALLLPFVFILLMMVIEFGFLMWTNLNVNASAREAARFAAVGNRVGNGDDSTDCGAGAGPPPFETVKGRAVQASLARVSCSEVTVTYHLTDQSRTFYGQGDEVRVWIAHPYRWLTPMGAMMTAFGWGGPGGEDLLLNACAQARLEVTYPESDSGSIVEAAAGCAS